MLSKKEAELKQLGANITANEIRQQPQLWKDTLFKYKENKNRIDNFIENIKKTTHRKIRVIFVGAGTSQYIGNTVTPYLTKNGDTQNFDFISIGSTDIVAAPGEYLLPHEVTIFVSFGRSGNSPESIGAVKLANQIVKNIYHIVITCAPDGLLAQMNQEKENKITLLMPSLSNDKGFAMTGSFTCMLLTALLIFDKRSLNRKKEYVQCAYKIGEEIITREKEILNLLPGKYSRIIYLGSGSLSELTREAQLKVLELTAGKIPTMFDSSLGFRHGPKSFVNRETVIFVFLNNDSYTRKYDNDIISELVNDEIAAAVIGIGQNDSTNQKDLGLSFIFNDESLKLPEGYLVLPDIMIAQIIALKSSVMIGNTPDTPSSNGTVNRVVKGVTIHEYDIERQ